MTERPTFSVIIPAYNRERLIERAVRSCLRQQHPSFEVVVVDDGSTDRTAACVAAIDDPRVRLFVQPANRGVSAARNLAVEQARGEWIVCLDSDDELTPDALDVMQAEIASVRVHVDGHRFMCRLDDGSPCPVPPLGRDVWDYEAYLRWAERVAEHGLQETATCVRRSTFEVVRFPEGGGEAGYHMDFAARFRTATSPAVVRLYHSDAPDQITRPDVGRAIAQAHQQARSFRLLLDSHGKALERCAPHLHAMYMRALAIQQFLSGDRMGGASTIARLVWSRPRSWGAWAVLGAGLLGPRPLALAQAERRRRLVQPI